ncbi:MAG: hypothetical protein ACREF1_00665 [Acetobacteraceae bacterium]
MSETALRNADLDAILAAVREHYVGAAGGHCPRCTGVCPDWR